MPASQPAAVLRAAALRAAAGVGLVCLTGLVSRDGRADFADSVARVLGVDRLRAAASVEH
ncbi:MAG TPA: hypothetical protein VFR23_22500 [Jiangellaceae bacterium]|nr:hypothetical protein [Jiangellaceae bacterium]